MVEPIIWKDLFTFRYSRCCILHKTLRKAFRKQCQHGRTQRPTVRDWRKINYVTRPCLFTSLCCSLLNSPLLIHGVFQLQIKHLIVTWQLKQWGKVKTKNVQQLGIRCATIWFEEYFAVQQLGVEMLYKNRIRCGFGEEFHRNGYGK